MLPIGTPPNAIVFSSGVLSMGDMARKGFLLNLIGVTLLTLGTVFYLVPHLGRAAADAHAVLLESDVAAHHTKRIIVHSL